MRFAITGATGFLGSTALRSLQDQGHEAIAVGRTQDLPEVDVVVHLAGSAGVQASLDDPAGDLEANVGETLRRLEELRRAGRRPTFVLGSSCAVYGAAPGTHPVDERAQLHPVSPYGASKAVAEQAALAYASAAGVPVRIARIANPVGPGQRRLVVYDLARRALDAGAPLQVRGTGDEIRDFIDVEDVARALERIALHGSAEDPIYNVGSGVPATLREVAELVAVEAGLTAQDVVFEGIGEPGKVNAFVPRVDRLRAIGFAPAIDLTTSIARTVRWTREDA